LRLWRPALLAAAVSWGCASSPQSPPQESAEGSPEAVSSPVPAPEGPAFDYRVPGAGGFVIGPGNVLDINVLGESELSLPVLVTEAGTISYPLLGEVSVAGFTPMKLERRLEELLAENYLVSPRVTIFIREYGKISVLGQIKKPGSYQYREQLTVTGAIALGGGLTDIADPNDTQVIRSEDGGKKVMRVRLKDILEGGEEEDDVVLRPGDIVFVPESYF